MSTTKKKAAPDCTITASLETPKGLITTAEAKAMEELYLKNQYCLINKQLQTNKNDSGDLDAREVWFSLDEIKKFILLTEQNANKNGYKNIGLRVYLGAKMEVNSSGKEVPRTSIFFVPTHEEKGENINSIKSESTKGNEKRTTNKRIEQSVILNLGQSGRPPAEL